MLLYILYNVWVDKLVDKYFKKKVKEKKRKIRKKMFERKEKEEKRKWKLNKFKKE